MVLTEFGVLPRFWNENDVSVFPTLWEVTQSECRIYEAHNGENAFRGEGFKGKVCNAIWTGSFFVAPVFYGPANFRWGGEVYICTGKGVEYCIYLTIYICDVDWIGVFGAKAKLDFETIGKRLRFFLIFEYKAVFGMNGLVWGWGSLERFA